MFFKQQPETAECVKVCGCIHLFYVCLTRRYKVLKHSGITLVGFICYINKIDFLKLSAESRSRQAEV